MVWLSAGVSQAGTQSPDWRYLGAQCHLEAETCHLPLPDEVPPTRPDARDCTPYGTVSGMRPRARALALGQRVPRRTAEGVHGLKSGPAINREDAMSSWWAGLLPEKGAIRDVSTSCRCC